MPPGCRRGCLQRRPLRAELVELGAELKQPRLVRLDLARARRRLLGEVGGLAPRLPRKATAREEMPAGTEQNPPHGARPTAK